MGIISYILSYALISIIALTSTDPGPVMPWSWRIAQWVLTGVFMILGSAGIKAMVDLDKDYSR